MRWGAFLGAFTAALIAGSVALAGFSSAPTATHSVSTDRIFPANRTTTAWSVADFAGGGTGAVGTAALAVDGDLRIVTTGAWSTTFSATRYFDVRLNSPLPAGMTVSGAKFTFAMLPSAGTETACFYFEVYRASTSTLLGTHGSSGSPVACNTGTAYADVITSLSEVTTSDIANDLRVRVYATNTASHANKIEYAAVSATHYQQFTLYPVSYTDASTGSATTTPWGPATAGDGTTYQTVANWATSYNSGRYITFTFPGYLPTNAVVSSATLINSYRPQTAADNACYYFEVYASGSLVGTHGDNTGSNNVSCDTGTGFQTDSISLSEVNTAARANNLAVKMYYKDSGAKPTQYDRVALQVNYSLDSSVTCPSPGSVSVNPNQDSYVDQNSAASNFGTLTTALVQSQSASRNRRALVQFNLPPTPTQCSLTAASLQLYADSVQGTRTIQAYQAASAWTETGVTWTNQPATTGSAATASNATGWNTWNVTSQVQAQLSGSNNGFILMDSAENGANLRQTYESRENTNEPTLTLTYG